MSNSSNSGGRNSDELILFGDNGAVTLTKETHLSIQNVSTMFRVSRVRLWFYERLGLIRRRNRFGQGFVYGWEDCARLLFVIKARRVGLSARQLAPLIKAAHAGASPRAVKRARAQCGELIERLEMRRRALREAIDELRFFYKLLSEKLPDVAPADTFDRADSAGTE